MDNEESSFKDRLIDELEYQGISKKYFAEKAGISINTLNMYLYRNSIPAADVAVKMAEILNTTVEYLVTGRVLSQKKEFSDKTAWEKREIQNIIDMLNQNQLENFIKIARAYKDALAIEK